jgi:hypothetical protein
VVDIRIEGSGCSGPDGSHEATSREQGVNNECSDQWVQMAVDLQWVS